MLLSLPTRRQTIRLHRVQSEFRHCPALYRGFVGGRGSGKTWAGAYDLIRRAKRGRTYLVGSPTYTILSDTTLPTFEALARELGFGVWAGMKATPRPNVRLSTGATVRFRSAEDPDSMRGPNLSGVWLDEASLMERGAYDVCIASLREGGEQGWLSATFTPQGLGHWTYDLFGRAKPDTAIFHARTRDNPFAPPGFHDTLALQYGGLRAAQELDGRFVNIEGSEWPAEYFADHIWADRLPTRFVVSALSLDPAQGKGEREKGCYAAFVVAGVDECGILWVDAWLNQTWDGNALVRETLQLHKLTGAQAVSVETNGGQQFLADLILHEARARSITLPLYGVNQVEQKELRIRAKLGPFLAQSRLRFRRGSPGAELLVQQLRDFPVGEYVDGPDALQQAVVMLDHLLGAQQTGAQPRVLRA
ncbi:MAG: phage terminase large subunit [Pseudomonadota bacterium]